MVELGIASSNEAFVSNAGSLMRISSSSYMSSRQLMSISKSRNVFVGLELIEQSGVTRLAPTSGWFGFDSGAGLVLVVVALLVFVRILGKTS